MNETKRTYAKWNIETYSERVKELYPWVYVIPGQEYRGVKYKLWHYCTVHGAYFTQPAKVMERERGCQCKGCKYDRASLKAIVMNHVKTLALVGQTTADGHLILEHIGYKQTPRDIDKGSRGGAVYRYECCRCGSTVHSSLGNSLMQKGLVQGCKDCGQNNSHESINQHLKNKAKALEPCQFYVSEVYYGDYLKIGISKQYDKRSQIGNQGNPYYNKDHTPEEHYLADGIDLSYEHCWYLSPWFPRSWVFAIEQILLRATLHYIPKKPLPKEMIELCWAGQTELRDWHLEPRAIQAAFIKLVSEIQRCDGDWYSVYSKHINNYQIA